MGNKPRNIQHFPKMKYRARKRDFAKAFDALTEVMRSVDFRDFIEALNSFRPIRIK
ncbi:hypothetical protein PXH69_24750 [Rhodococcus qingshengii]|uniref:Transposase n=1 Tax=Rhodococcus qingshengii TaxID=334542 RepID=A0AAW6LRU5_RHOSG|nr:hypothetical protein [Rhodococcus qingshengii]MDE8648181.1 hypothetical protein [Rhodococcus qingshengii]